MDDISPPSGMKPKAKFFADVGEDMVNIDGVIEVMRRIDTPKAKRLYHLFRKHLAKHRNDNNVTPEKQREKALFAALAEAGIEVTTIGIIGS